MLYFNWTNDPVVRANSYSSAEISLEKHREWFTSKISDPSTAMYVFEKDSVPFGQIRFNIEGVRAKINFSVDKNFRGKRLGKYILEEGAKTLFKEYQGINEAYGYVFKSNTASIKAFHSAGYTFTRDEKVEGVDSVIFTLQREILT